MCAYVSRDLRVVITSLPLASGHRGLCALGSMHQWPWVYAGCNAYGSALWRPVHLVVPLRTPHGASAHPPLCLSAPCLSAPFPHCGLCLSAPPPFLPQRTTSPFSKPVPQAAAGSYAPPPSPSPTPHPTLHARGTWLASSLPLAWCIPCTERVWEAMLLLSPPLPHQVVPVGTPRPAHGH